MYMSANAVGIADLVHDLQIRTATAADATLLYIWRNDALTCAMSRNPVPVRWQEHVAWLTRRLDHEMPNLFIAEIEGQAVGTFRIDGDEVSYTVCPTARGRGIATAMLKAAKRKFGPLRAEIYPENLASICAAKRAGMKIVVLPRRSGG